MIARCTVRRASIAALAAAGFLGCGGKVVEPGGAQSVTIAVQPPAVQVGTGHFVNFDAVVTGTANTAVTWSIQEGTPAGGSITTAGTYTAPLTTGTFHVVAQSQADSSKTAAATVTVVQVTPPPASALACAAEPINTSGHTVYYACDCQGGADPNCVAGNDTNSGTSPTAPFQTYAKIRGKFPSLLPGDTIAFCQGGSFANNASTWTNTNCTATSPCTVRDYVDPRWTAAVPGQRPILNSAAAARGMDLSAQQSGIRVLNLKLLAAGPGGDGFALSGPGTGPGTDITICNVEVNGYGNGIEFYRSAVRLTVVGSRFVNNNQQGILGGSDGTIIKDSDFDNNGTNSPYPPGYAHALYVGAALGQDSRYPGPLTDMTISGNKITNTGVTNGVCSGPPLVSHGAVDGMLIENNYIDGRGPAGTDNGSYNNGGCFGIMVSPGGYSSATYFRNYTIRRNRLVYIGNEGISLSECNPCTVEDNVIITGRAGARAINMPHDYQRSGDPQPNGNVTVQNNTIYMTGAGVSGAAVFIGHEGTGYVVSSNAIYYTGSDTSFDCFDIDSPSARLSAMDHNLCYRPNAAGAHWMTDMVSGGSGTSSWSLSAWQTATGFDPNSLQSSPLFTSLTEPWNFTPCLTGDPGCSGTSPLIGAADPAHYSPIAIGSVIWDPADPGKARDANPDIGAYER